MQVRLPEAIIPETVKALLGITSQDNIRFQRDPERMIALQAMHLNCDVLNFKWVDGDARGPNGIGTGDSHAPRSLERARFAASKAAIAST
jgi:hypothetical protein